MATKRKTPSRRRSPASPKRPSKAPGRSAKPAVRMTVYRGRGTTRPPAPAGQRLAALSLAEKTKLLASVALPAPGTVYVTLSPSRPLVANQGALAFEHPQLVDGGWDYVTWKLWHPGVGESYDDKWTLEEGKGVKRTGIWFKSEAAGRRYLVDCAVSRPPTGATQTFSVFRGDALVQETELPDDGGHLVFVVETQDASWYGFTLMSDRTWTFWWCEITRL